jgi:hypothetical protein
VRTLCAWRSTGSSWLSFPALCTSQLCVRHTPARPQGETKGASPTIVFCQLDETVEHRFQPVVGNTLTAVADGTDNVITDVLETYDDRAVSGGTFEGVAQQTAEHLKDPRRITLARLA